MTTTTHTGRRLRRGLLCGVLAACALPAGASAATVEIQGNDVLKYRGGDDRNTLSVREESGSLIVADSAGVSNIFIPVTDPRPRCAIIDSRTVRCPLRVNGRSITRFEAELGDNHDIARNLHTGLPVIVSGGSGDDIYEAGNPPFLTRVDYRGGSGADNASYAGAGQSAGGAGVRISNDGVANDGRIGLDTDNIRTDVERLTGSAFADELTASVNSDRGRVFVTPGQGDDVMRAGSGPGNGVLFFLMGPVADGADKIIGGPVPSVVDYDDRTRPVTATLNFGGADDGEAGERDEILGGNEFLNGGQAGDTLSATRFSTTPMQISGSGGNDSIDGADGADTLSGGAGADVIRAFSGDDKVSVADSDRDVAGCGLGTDTIEIDSRDVFEACESRVLAGPVGVLRLTPRTLRARAGEAAQLKLRWRHPRSWKQLRRIELRLYRGESRVGAVAISTRRGRIADRGAVSVLRRSRFVRKGKTVSARLALRFDRRLAGRRLRVEVTAVDVRGARQLEPRAGSIRVSR